MIIVFSALLLIIAIFLLLDSFSTKHKRMQKQIKRIQGNTKKQVLMDQRNQELSKSARERIWGPVLGRFAAIALRFSPQGKSREIAKKIRAAGLRTSPQVFLALKSGLTLASAIFGFVGLLFFQNVVFMGVGMVIAAFAYIGPERWLAMRAKKRSEEMERMLPDTLDLLTVSVEAGLGFDAALSKVCEKMRGPLIDEMKITAQEIRIGASRRDALRNLAIRSGSDQIASFCTSIIQAEELGVSLGRTLRVQSGDIRTKRQLAAEEKAMKAPVKMLFPTVLFIFPAMFIVILGPAFVNIVQSFKGM